MPSPFSITNKNPAGLLIVDYHMVYPLLAAFGNKIYFHSKPFNLASIYIVCSSCTALTNIPTEGRSFRMGEKKKENLFLLTGSISMVQLARFLQKAVKPRIEKQPPTVNSHGKLKDRRTCII